MKYQKQAVAPKRLETLLAVVNTYSDKIDLPTPKSWDWPDVTETEDSNNGTTRVLVIDYIDNTQRRDYALLDWKNATLDRITKNAAVSLILNLRSLGYECTVNDCPLKHLRCDIELGDLLSAVFHFNRIYDLFDTIIELGSQHDLDTRTWSQPFVTEGQLAPELISISVDSIERRIRFRVNQEVEVLQGCKLDRIRRCVVCRRYFWAKRLPVSTCDKKCGNVLNARRFRIREAEKRLQAERVKKEKQLNRGIQPTDEIIINIEETIARMEYKLLALKSKYDHSR